jgi:hypothetical protein
MDEVTKLLKSLSTRMERLEVEGKQTYINPQNVDNRGNFKRPNNNAPQIMQREQRNIEIEMIKKSRPLFKTTLLWMRVERKKTLIQKSTVLKTHPLLLT